jgi:mono/diheme cytochrome c family protein
MRNLLIVVLALMPILAYAVDEAEAMNIAAGEAIYGQTCIACHAANGKGAIPGVTDFTAKDSPLLKSDTELEKNISVGFQTPGAMMGMPAKGGNPGLTEEDVRAVLAYIRNEFGK